MPENDFSLSSTDVTISIPLNPIDWYALIKYSKGYIGERMHPIVVSLHNSVPFIVLMNMELRLLREIGFSANIIRKLVRRIL